MSSRPNTIRGLLLALTLAFCGSWASADVASRNAPNCPLAAWGSGQAINLQQYRGKVVYVDFWASWCSSCAQSFPFLNQLHADLEEKGLVVLGINVDEKPKDASAFLNKYPARFAVVAATGMECPKAFAVPGMPATFLIDRQGVIRASHIGFSQGKAEKLRVMTEALLNEPVPAE